MRGKQHSDETRAQVMAALLAGQAVTEVAEQYNLPHNTVSDLRKRAGGQFDELRQKNRGLQIENLLFDYLTANLIALRKQAEVVSEATYIERQPAGDVAVLHGVMADKSIRLLEAIHRANSKPDEARPPLPAPGTAADNPGS